MEKFNLKEIIDLISNPLKSDNIFISDEDVKNNKKLVFNLILKSRTQIDFINNLINSLNSINEVIISIPVILHVFSEHSAVSLINVYKLVSHDHLIPSESHYEFTDAEEIRVEYIIEKFFNIENKNRSLADLIKAVDNAKGSLGTLLYIILNEASKYEYK